MTVRRCCQGFLVAVILLATRSVAEPSDGSLVLRQLQAGAVYDDGVVPAPLPSFSDSMPGDQETVAPAVIAVANARQPEPDMDILASMSGKCSTLKIAGRDFACRAVAFFHSGEGRANFAIALDDAADDSHIVTFSGENSRREQDNSYELQIDRMLLNSRSRPKVDGLPVPAVELATGTCKQLGSFVTRQVSSISCSAVDRNGRKYELQFDSDGSPIMVRRIWRAPLATERRRTLRTEQLECRHKASLAQVLPRDLTAYIIGCLEADSQKSTPAANP